MCYYRTVKLAQKPLISVILPVYNANGYLPLALDSILNQTYHHFELIAIDDGSTDNSLAILKNYAKKDKRIKVIQNKRNLNIANSLNKAIKLAKGQYIARMDADDISLPQRFQKQINFLLKHPEVVILGGQVRTMDVQSKSLGHKLFPILDRDIRESLYTSNPIQHPTAIINKFLLPKNFSWYNPALPPAEDYDLFFRLGQFGKYHNLNHFVLKYRQYLGSSTFKNPIKTFSATQKVRKLAVTKYNYKPSPKAKLINFIQIISVAILPDSLIYPLYVLVRGIESPVQIIVNYIANNKYLNNLRSKASKLSA